MSDYIDKSNLYKSIADREEEYRSALLKEKDYNTATALQLQGLLNATTLIKHLVFDYPTVEAEPVRYGRWQVNETNGYKDMTCLSCGWLFEYYDGLEEEWNYCPHCGALQSFATERHINTVRNADV